MELIQWDRWRKTKLDETSADSILLHRHSAFRRALPATDKAALSCFETLVRVKAAVCRQRIPPG